MSEGKLSRRAAVQRIAGAGAALTIVPRHVLGGPGYQAPSDLLNIACIGVGGKGFSDVRGVSGENIYALCDVDDERAARSFDQYPQARRYRDFREMLSSEGDNIDAVTVSTPDHTHAAAAVMAMRMGKAVFCQKPLARTLSEVRVMRQVARESGVATQMGNQGHASDSTREIREWVEAGAIGTVREVHYWTDRPIWPQGIDQRPEAVDVPTTLNWDLWLGPAPLRPYAPDYAPFAWRGWWDFGTGALGDIACHSMDVAYWALDLGYPSRIEAETTPVNRETAPTTSRIVYDFPERNGRGPIKVVWRDGGLAPAMPPGLGLGRRWPVESIGGQLWVGDDGMLLAGVYGEQPRLLDRGRHREILANPPAVKYPRSPGVYEEWLRAIRGGEPAGSGFDAHSGPLTETVLLGNLAVRTGGPVDLDPETGAVMTEGVPAEYLEPTYREGWTL
jgi:predicted dehydrogenase